MVDIYGAEQPGYNGTFTIANVTASTFDITVPTTAATPAPGRISVRRQEPIELAGLADGTYTVYVVAKDSADLWQSVLDATASQTWTVTTLKGVTGSAPKSTGPLQAASTPAVMLESQIPGGTITVDTVLIAEAGPYRITGNVVVNAGVTLTIEPGTTLFFDSGTSLTVNGRLLAEGTEYETIRFTRVPGGGNWGGIQFANTMEDNRITYAVLEYGVTSNGLVGVVNSNLLVDHSTFDHTDRRRIRTLDSSLIVRNSYFTNIFDVGHAADRRQYL